jgi:hypothetical protein
MALKCIAATGRSGFYWKGQWSDACLSPTRGGRVSVAGQNPGRAPVAIQFTSLDLLVLLRQGKSTGTQPVRLKDKKKDLLLMLEIASSPTFVGTGSTSSQ